MRRSRSASRRIAAAFAASSIRGVVDLIEERFDVGIRAGRLEDSSLIAKSLGAIERILVATPAYSKKRGRPRTPAGLKKHDCLLFGNDPTLTRDGQRGDVSLAPRLLVTDMDVLEIALKDDLGIAVMSTPRVRKRQRPGPLGTGRCVIGSGCWTRTNDLAVNSRLLLPTELSRNVSAGRSRDRREGVLGTVPVEVKRIVRRPSRRSGLALATRDAGAKEVPSPAPVC